MSFTPASFYRKLSKINIRFAAGKADMTGVYTVRLPGNRAAEVQEWCEERFGDNWIWSMPTQVDWIDIHLADPEDATAVRLTFGAKTEQ